jgi:PPOX class probable F420-dependent enzyme
MSASLLENHRYMSLITFRENGRPVPTPVWFAEDDGKLYVVTGVISGKVKRIRQNPQVEIAPCTMHGEPLGPAIPAVARVLDLKEFSAAEAALDQKYGEDRRRNPEDTIFAFEQVYLEITPQ